MITSKQCKAARILLEWTAKDLSLSSGVNASCISRFERNNVTPNSESVVAIARAFKRNGIRFIESHGIELQNNFSEILQGPNCINDLWERIYESFGNNEGGEVLITNVDERRTIDKVGNDLVKHIENLGKANISERLLSCEDDTFFVTDPSFYRWLPKELFNIERSTYVFNGCVAIQLWHSDVVVFLRNKAAYLAEKERFENMWARAKIPQILSKTAKTS